MSKQKEKQTLPTTYTLVGDWNYKTILLPIYHLHVQGKWRRSVAARLEAYDLPWRCKAEAKQSFDVRAHLHRPEEEMMMMMMT